MEKPFGPGALLGARPHNTSLISSSVNFSSSWTSLPLPLQIFLCPNKALIRQYISAFALHLILRPHLLSTFALYSGVFWIGNFVKKKNVIFLSHSSSHIMQDLCRHIISSMVNISLISFLSCIGCSVCYDFIVLFSSLSSYATTISLISLLIMMFPKGPFFPFLQYLFNLDKFRARVLAASIFPIKLVQLSSDIQFDWQFFRF